MGSIDQKAPLPLFVTLTYPAKYPTARQSKIHLDRLLKRIARKYPKAAGVWRLEAQQRGAPHYHVLIWNEAYIPHAWIAEAWYAIVGSLDPNHLSAGTQTCRSRAFRQVWHYTSKYLAKPTENATGDSWDHPGRFWGIFNREMLPLSETAEFPLSDRAYYDLRRAMWRARRARVKFSTPTAVHHFAGNTKRWLQYAVFLS